MIWHLQHALQDLGRVSRNFQATCEFRNGKSITSPAISVFQLFFRPEAYIQFHLYMLLISNKQLTVYHGKMKGAALFPVDFWNIHTFTYKSLRPLNL